MPVSTKKPVIMQSVPIPFPVHSGSFSSQNSPTKPLFRGIQAGDLAAANAARAAKLTKWAKLDLRQGFADEAFMRSHIKVTGLRAPNNMEPGTTSRLRSLLRRADIHAPEITEALATTLSGYLMLNPSLPLWAALALVLEATGRFSDLACAESS